MLVIVLIVVLLLAIGGLPVWPYAIHDYGYYPSGLFGMILVVLLVMLLLGYRF